MKRRRLPLLLGLALVAAVCAVYWPVGTFEFLDCDDPDYVTQNSHVLGGLSADGVVWAFTTTHAANWHPLTWLSHMLDVGLFGVRAGPHHWVNVLLHAANAVLLLLVLRRMTGATWRSALVAGLFALHPLHVESVAWVAERKDVLSGLFGFATLYAYVRYAQTTERRARLVWYALALLGLAAGLMSKPTLVTWPCVLLLLDFWPLGRFTAPGANRSSRLSLLLEKAPFFTLALASSVLTLRAQAAGGALSGGEMLTLFDRIQNAVVAYATYLWKAVLPQNLAFFYPHPVRWPAGRVFASALSLAGITVLCARYRRPNRDYLLTGWLWYLGTLVPMIGLVQVGGQSMADRYTYLPLVGVFIMVAWAAKEAVTQHSHWRPVLQVLAAVALLALAVCSFRQTTHWRDTATLARHALQTTRNNYFAHLNLALNLSRQGRGSEAIPHFHRTIALRPHYPGVHFGLATVLLEQGQRAEAAQEYLAELRVNPRHFDARNNLGLLLMEEGKLAEAFAHLENAAHLKPDDPILQYNLAVVLDQTGHPSEAVAHLRTALRLRPNWPEVLNNLAWFLATHRNAGIRNGAEAVALAERACTLTVRTNVALLHTLAAAYAENADFANAVRTAQAALDLARTSDRADEMPVAARRLELYRAGQPYRP